MHPLGGVSSRDLGDAVSRVGSGGETGTAVLDVDLAP